MYLKVRPSSGLAEGLRNFSVPSSKPETQRALLLGALTNGRSVVHGDLRCQETTTMKRAAQALGAQFEEQDGKILIDGVSLRSRTLSTVPIIDCKGSGLVCRVFTVLCSAMRTPTAITGDDILRGREMRPLFQTLDRLNRPLAYLCDPYRLPVLVQGGGLHGGVYDLPGDVSSQFITALLVGAPFAEAPVEIRVHGPVLSGSYIRQTLAAMRLAGIDVEHDEGLTRFRVPLGEYKPFETRILGDYTSASYFLAAAALFEGRTVLRNMSAESLQGERAMLRILDALGVSTRFDGATESLVIDNSQGLRPGHYEFDVSDCPNIVPTLAALGSFVEGTFRVVGGSITRLHKSPRAEAMATELRKVGVDISLVTKHGLVDGFEIRGRRSYEGGGVLSSWRDHRNFMSLFVASLRMKRPNLIDGYSDTDCSFPGFLEQFAQHGVGFDVVDRPEPVPAAISGTAIAI